MDNSQRVAALHECKVGCWVRGVWVSRGMERCSKRRPQSTRENIRVYAHRPKRKRNAISAGPMRSDSRQPGVGKGGTLWGKCYAVPPVAHLGCPSCHPPTWSRGHACCSHPSPSSSSAPSGRFAGAWRKGLRTSGRSCQHASRCSWRLRGGGDG